MNSTDIPTIGTQGNYFGTVTRHSVAKNVSLAETWYQGGTVIPRHRHEHPSLFLLINGIFETAIASERRNLSANTATFLQSDGVHEARVLSRTACGFNLEVVGDSALHLSGLYRGQVLCSQVVVQLMRQLYYELSTENIARELAMDGLAMQLIAALKREHERVCSIPPAWLKKAKELLTDTSDERLNLSKLSSILSVEPGEIVRVFRTYLDTTPAAFYRSARMAAACQRLIATDESLTQLAIETGFYDQAHFSHHFRQVTGLTPSEYRRLFGRKQSGKNTKNSF